MNEALVSAYEAALSKIRKSLTALKGGTNAEAEYAAAYQRLVAAGLRPKLRRRYR